MNNIHNSNLLKKLYFEIYGLFINNTNNKTIFNINNLNVSNKSKKVLSELDKNSNYGITFNIMLKNVDNLNNVALLYRGNTITYKELFSNVYRYAKSLKKLGYKFNDEILVCMSNTPEYIYLFLAANLIGAKLNVIGDWFDKDYTEFIINNSNSKNIFITDDVYDYLKDKINDTSVSNVIVYSLTDSLRNGINPYQEIDDRFHDFSNKTSLIKKDCKKNVILNNDFIEIGKDYNNNVVYNTSLDDEAIITYTSGTTAPGTPKAVLHSNRSYITLARFKDKDISGLASMEGKTVLHHIPTYTHMEMCSLVDSLYQGCVLALEPFYQKDFFKYSIVMHKPNYSPGSVGFYMDFCKNLENNPEFKNVKLPNFEAVVVTGEGLSAGEEKYFNYVARKHKIGKGSLPIPITFSIGGGTSESSGIFTTLFKEYLQKLYLGSKEIGLITLPFAETEVLNKNGTYALINEKGDIVANSPCNMLRYYYTEKDYSKLKTSNQVVTDAYGKTWMNINTKGYKTNLKNSIKMLGRENNIRFNHLLVSLPEIEEIVLKDTKNIMSASVINVGENIIVHVEFSPVRKKSKSECIMGIINRLRNNFPQFVLDNIYIRIHTNKESFAVAPSGKRDYNILLSEGLTDKCININNYEKKCLEKPKVLVNYKPKVLVNYKPKVLVNYKID